MSTHCKIVLINAGRPGRGKTKIIKNFSKVNDLLPALTGSDILSFRGRERHTILSLSLSHTHTHTHNIYISMLYTEMCVCARARVCVCVCVCVCINTIHGELTTCMSFSTFFLNIYTPIYSYFFHYHIQKALSFACLGLLKRTYSIENTSYREHILYRELTVRACLGLCGFSCRPRHEVLYLNPTPRP